MPTLSSRKVPSWEKYAVKLAIWGIGNASKAEARTHSNMLAASTRSKAVEAAAYRGAAAYNHMFTHWGAAAAALCMRPALLPASILFLSPAVIALLMLLGFLVDSQYLLVAMIGALFYLPAMFLCQDKLNSWSVPSSLPTTILEKVGGVLPSSALEEENIVDWVASQVGPKTLETMLVLAIEYPGTINDLLLDTSTLLGESAC